MSNSNGKLQVNFDYAKYAELRTFLQNVWLGDCAYVRWSLRNPNSMADPNEIDAPTGMNALHIAVGRNNLEMAQLLVEAGVKAIPDNEGRMPSLIAAELGVSEELADFIFEVEARDQKADALQTV
jgi:ankyrin repeat protein